MDGPREYHAKQDKVRQKIRSLNFQDNTILTFQQNFFDFLKHLQT